MHYDYHNSPSRLEREELGICRCASPTDGRAYELKELIRDGIIMDPESVGAPLTTQFAPGTRPESVGLPPRYIYAISTSLEMRIAPDGTRAEPNAVKHESLFHNEVVLAAGELGFENGLLASLNDHSGSYETDGELEANSDFVVAVLRAVLLNEIPITESLLSQLNELRDGHNAQ
jgi:hypothetical protein